MTLKEGYSILCDMLIEDEDDVDRLHPRLHLGHGKFTTGGLQAIEVWKRPRVLASP